MKWRENITFFIKFQEPYMCNTHSLKESREGERGIREGRGGKFYSLCGNISFHEEESSRKGRKGRKGRKLPVLVIFPNDMKEALLDP